MVSMHTVIACLAVLAVQSYASTVALLVLLMLALAPWLSRVCMSARTSA
jgi:C4-dicarboxylate transporter